MSYGAAPYSSHPYSSRRVSAAAGVPATASGDTIELAVSLIAGSASGAAIAPGAIITVSADGAIISNGAHGKGRAPGATMVIALTLIAGGATGSQPEQTQRPGGSSEPSRERRKRPLQLEPASRKTRDGRTVDPRTLRPVAEEPARPQRVEAEAETQGEYVRSREFEQLQRILTAPPTPQAVAPTPDYSDDEAILLLLA